jgi:ABC-2 type transport system ATP-binding protein
VTAAGGATTDPAIDVLGLTKRYGGRSVVRDVSFGVERGEICALLGPNGAGKTTTVEIIEGYRRPDAGSVVVLGADPARAGRDHRAHVGLMLQGGGGIEPRLTPLEVVSLYARFHSDALDPATLLRSVGIGDATASRTRYRRLSGGERQRVALAVALVGRPAVAILDEPAAGMDVEARGATRELLARLRGDGMTILLTSHDLGDVERLADRIAILDRGRLVAFGRPEELTGSSRPVIRFRVSVALDDGDRTALAASFGRGAPANAAVAVDPDGGPGRYRLTGAGVDPAAIARLAAWCEERGALITELRAGSATLEERYLELTGGAADEEVA